MFEFRICLGYGVMTDDKLFGQRTDAGQLITLLKDACLDGMPDLLHQLQIQRLPSGIIEREDQLSTVPLLVYSERPLLFPRPAEQY